MPDSRRGETLTTKVRFYSLNVCEGVYDSDMHKPRQERQELWADVRHILVKWDRNERIVMLSDFNGWVGAQRDGYEKSLR
ncbi:hypothetical protein EVAR_52415_1 [Eumeta japonica]|uniref:Endonuclease/exonuclease/phosphatase domain-containing protein n=1 Tax=Eumeta variegata TaxID=151549 RepID=A0A4C1YHN3_EUMVA|nr:hypothetical protein EVAR_52415_1 [Eumeta japonica]